MVDMSVPPSSSGPIQYGFQLGGKNHLGSELQKFIKAFRALLEEYPTDVRDLENFLEKFHNKFKEKFKSSTILADSEYGSNKILDFIEKKINWIGRISSYGNSSDGIKLTKQERDDRKTVERVIARLVNNWNLERPSHVGEAFVNFHLQIAVLYDLLQVSFNIRIGNKNHPHAMKEIRG